MQTSCAVFLMKLFILSCLLILSFLFFSCRLPRPLRVFNQYPHKGQGTSFTRHPKGPLHDCYETDLLKNVSVLICLSLSRAVSSYQVVSVWWRSAVLSLLYERRRPPTTAGCCRTVRATGHYCTLITLSQSPRGWKLNYFDVWMIKLLETEIKVRFHSFLLCWRSVQSVF